MNSNHNSGTGRWRLLLLGIIAAALVALGIIAYASSQRIIDMAEVLAIEDAGLMDWWVHDQRATLNVRAASLASRVTVDTDFEELVAQARLADHAGYVAWIGADKTVLGARQAEMEQGDPTSSKMFAYVSAINQPAADFWHDGEVPYLVSMAPVSADQGGGVILIQQPLDDSALAQLAEMTGRDVVFYSFDGAQPLISSNPQLVASPLVLDQSWINEVATSQQPAAIRTTNGQGGQVVSMTAFPDFAGITYSGYLALVEPFSTLSALVSQLLYWIAIAIAVLLLAVGCLLLYRKMSAYLQSFQAMDWRQRRAFRWRSAGLMFLFILPIFLAGWLILDRTTTTSRTLNLRTGQIAKEVVFPTFDEVTERINHFATDPNVPTLKAEAIDALAEKVRMAASADFAIIEHNGEQVQSGFEELEEDIVAQLDTIGERQSGVVSRGKATYFAAKQTLVDGATAVVGVRLDKQADAITDMIPADLTLFRGNEPLSTSLSDREIESFSFTPEVEAELAQNGEVSYVQDLSWYESKLAASKLAISDADDWRLLVSQRSITWHNTIRAYQAFGTGILVLMLLIMGILLATVLNLDKPMLLRRLYTGFGFILPASIWLVWWQLGPALFTGYLSFHKWSVLNPAKPAVGFHNYRLLWNDEKFWNAMGNTFYYLAQIPISLVLALMLALVLNRKLRGIKILRTIYYMPAVTSIVVVALMWQLLYNKDLGIFNYLLDFVGLGPYGWLQSTTMAMPSIMGMAVWLGLGARMLLFLAGLQSISNDFYEAAEVDGAGPWPKFLHITVPLLAPTTFFVFTTAIIQSFQVFGPIYVLTAGGPAGATDVAVYRIWFEAWQNLRFGYASAETVILFAFLFVVTAVQFRYFGRSVSYG